MPLYEYRAVDSSGEHVDGRVDAASEEIALEILREESMQPVSVREIQHGQSPSSSGTNIVVVFLIVGFIGLIGLVAVASIAAMFLF